MNLNQLPCSLLLTNTSVFALEEDIHSEDVSTNAVMPEYKSR